MPASGKGASNDGIMGVCARRPSAMRLSALVMPSPMASACATSALTLQSMSSSTADGRKQRRRAASRSGRSSFTQSTAVCRPPSTPRSDSGSTLCVNAGANMRTLSLQRSTNRRAYSCSVPHEIKGKHSSSRSTRSNIIVREQQHSLPEQQEDGMTLRRGSCQDPHWRSRAVAGTKT